MPLRFSAQLIRTGRNRTRLVPPRPRPRSSHRLDQSPLAVTTSGSIVVGLGYSMDVRTVADLIKVISTTTLKPGQSWFVGVVLDHRRRADALRRLDDGAAEAAAQSGVGASTTKRKASGH